MLASRQKCTKIDFGRGSAPDPAEKLTVLPRPSSWNKGAYFYMVQGGKGEEKEGKAGEGRIGRGRKEMEGSGGGPRVYL